MIVIDNLQVEPSVRLDSMISKGGVFNWALEYPVSSNIILSWVLSLTLSFTKSILISKELSSNVGEVNALMISSRLDNVKELCVMSLTEKGCNTS